VAEEDELLSATDELEGTAEDELLATEDELELEVTTTDELLEIEDELGAAELELETVELETTATFFAAKLVFGAFLSPVGLFDVLR
jgi:hypothetical protein